MAKVDGFNKIKQSLTSNYITTSGLAKLGFKVAQDGSKKSMFDLLGLPNFTKDDIVSIFPETAYLDREILDLLSIEAKYHNYLVRQQEDILLFKKEYTELIPPSIDYDQIGSLSVEIREKLKSHKPQNIANAKTIQGMTPAALLSLIIYIKSSKLELFLS